MMKERERVLARLYVAEDGSQQLVLLSPFAGGRSVWLYEDGTRFPFPQMKDGLYLGATEAFAGRSIHARSGRRLSAPFHFGRNADATIRLNSMRLEAVKEKAGMRIRVYTNEEIPS